MNLRVFSIFSGISAASVAWQPLGFKMVGYCEPAAFPARVLHQRLGATSPKYLPDGKDFAAKHYAGMEGGRIINFGDIEQITNDDLRRLGPVDILEGGSPCQAFSVAGNRGGLDDARGNLALAFAKLALRMKDINGLRFVVWENVTGALSHEDNPLGCLLAAFSGEPDPVLPPGRKWPDSGHLLARGESEGEEAVTIAWRVLRAEHFGVAQRRHRVFLVASFNPDIDAGRILFEPEGESWHPATSRSPQQADSRCRPQGAEPITALIGMDSDTSIQVHPEIAFALKASNARNPQVVIHPELVGTLCASGAGTARTAGQGNELDFVVIQRTESGADAEGYVCRRLLPIECERLQGFADGWTDILVNGKPARDSDRYKAIGNSMAVPCLGYIGDRLRQSADKKDRREILLAA